MLFEQTLFCGLGIVTLRCLKKQSRSSWRSSAVNKPILFMLMSICQINKTVYCRKVGQAFMALTDHMTSVYSTTTTKRDVSGSRLLAS